MPLNAVAGPFDGHELRRRVAALQWYHTIELPQGVVTPGFADLRRYLPRYPIAELLDGLRALDVATFDGFWAFELERRGAREVVFQPGLPGRFMSYQGGREACVWFMSLGALEQMIRDAGFRRVTLMDRFPIQYRDEVLWHAVFEAEP